MGARAVFLLLLTIARLSDAEPPKPAWTAHIIDPRTDLQNITLADANGDAAPDLLVAFADGSLRFYLSPDWQIIDAGKGSAIAAVLHAEGKSEIAAAVGPSILFAGDAIAGAPALDWTAIAAADLDTRHSPDIIAGARYQHARIGWFESIGSDTEPTGWRWHPLADAGWITALHAVDMDSDKDPDILYADRFGGYRGVFWLENPARLDKNWTRHAITAEADRPESVFLTTGDIDRDGLADVISAALPDQIWLHRRRATHGREWQSFRVTIPPGGPIRGAQLADLNHDQRSDLVYAVEDAPAGRNGIGWLSYRRSFAEDTWRAHDISGPGGGDFRGLELLDADGDGDLDIVTADARTLGIVWFENPSSTPKRKP